MKKFLKGVLVVAAATMTFACSDTACEIANGTLSDENLVELTISTEKPEAVDTRTMVAEDGKTPMWCPGDAIGVSVLSGGSYTNHEFTSECLEASKTTTFTGKTAVGDLIYTYYPYSSAGVTSEGKAMVTIPAVQNPGVATFDGAADILVGKPVPMNPETTKIEGLQFKRVGGFLKIVINDQSGMLADETFYKISVTAENNLAGDVYLDIVNGELGEIYENGSTTVTANCASDCEGTAWLGIYPQILTEGSTITIAATTDSYDIERSISLPYDIEIKEGQITTLNIKITAENISEKMLVIDEAFPDPIFRQYVSDNFDTNHDGKLSKEEILKVTEINVEKTNSTPDEEKIASLEGIQYFTNLVKLYCSYNLLTTLDVSRNTKLTSLYCEHNRLTTLDVSKNTALITLYCHYNRLTTLDVSKNTALITLYCISNQLTRLDVSKNTALTSLSCEFNQLMTLDVSKNTALEKLWCGNNQLTDLDVSKNTALIRLYCYYNQLTDLDVSKNTALDWLECTSNQLTSLDVSNNTALTVLWCGGNQLTILNVSKNTALDRLDCGVNQLTSLDVSNNTALTGLSCHSNPLTTLDVSKNTELKTLGCSGNHLTSLDVSGNTKLTTLNCPNNQLTTLDLLKNTALTSLRCYGNQLTTLDVSNTNLGNSTERYPLDCRNMSTLDVLYLKTGWSIQGITEDNGRSTSYIPEQTKIVFIDGDYGEGGGSGGEIGDGGDHDL